ASHESYRGNDFTVVGGKARGIVGNFVVLASDANVFEKVVRTQQGRSLGDSTDYERAVSVLPRDRIATAYLDTVRSLESAARSAGGSASQLAALGPLTTLAPIAVGVFLRGDGIVVDGAIHRSGPVSISRGPGLLARLPADTRAALSVPQVGPGLSDLFSAPSSSTAHLALGALLKARTGLDLDSDLLSWMGDVAFFVTDIAHLRGGAVVESSAPATSRRVVEQIGESLLSRGLDVTLTPRTPQQSAFKVRSRHLPTLHVTASKSDVQAIFGSVPLASDELHLGDEPMFERAETSLGQDYSIKGFVDARTLVSYFERGSAGSTALPATAKAAVRPLSFIGLGTRSDRDTLFARLVIGVN
ncbi:MAG: hypothetical protein QOC87_373, partial [Actinomycetota bacterium]|nr:hypothetical protein [Actinomycetota bacterium]